MNIIDEIAAERRRQIEAEGWTSEHDDQHSQGEMLDAARCYLSGDPTNWPWDAHWWKPKSRRRDLIRAGALAQAEHERLMRVLDRMPPRRLGTPVPPERARVLVALTVADVVRIRCEIEIDRLDRVTIRARKDMP